MNTIPNTGPINISSNNLENESNQTNRTIQNNAVSSRAVSAMDMNINEEKALTR